MTGAYLGALEDLRRLKLSEEVLATASRLDETLDQAILLESTAQLTSLLKRYRGAPGGAATLAQSLRRLVESGDYLQPGKYPITLTFNEDLRKYEAWWRTRTADMNWLGPTKRILISADPLLDVRVESRFDRKKNRYGYTICNRADSAAPTEHLGVKIVGLNDYRNDQLQQWAQENRFFPFAKIFYPSGHLQEFILWPRNEDGSYVFVQPGDCATIPEVLGVPWPSLPGIVPAWIEPKGYRPEVSVESDPECLAMLFKDYEFEQTPAGRKKAPRRFYEGRVLGPVPLPEPGASAESFARRLLEEDWKTAEEWGWTAESERVDEFEKRLSCILEADSRKACTPGLLQQSQELESAGLILPELGILLRENLNYLSDESNW